MALRQQQQIDSQHQLLATKEQRLRFLKQQEVRNAVANAEGERLRRLRERVEAQESKLRRLRALRGQVDLQKTYNVTLSEYLNLFTFNWTDGRTEKYKSNSLSNIVFVPSSIRCGSGLLWMPYPICI